MANTWEQQDSESAKAFAAFKVYRDLLPSKRSLAGSWEAQKGVKKGTNLPGHFKRWYYNFEWASRARSYDLYHRQLEEEARAEAQRETAKKWAERVEEQREDEWDLRTKLVGKANLMLAFPLSETKIEEGVDGQEVHIHPAQWRFRDVATLLLTISKVGRLATGQETDRILEINWESLSDEQLQMIANGADPDTVIKQRGGDDEETTPSFTA
jgi:hypothetical protein